jgi:hypothetical protein
MLLLYQYPIEDLAMLEAPCEAAIFKWMVVFYVNRIFKFIYVFIILLFLNVMIIASSYIYIYTLSTWIGS